MFEKLTVKKLKSLISTFKKEHNVIGSVSKMKKADLVKEMEEHFDLFNDKLIIKSKQTPIEKVAKKKVTTEYVPTAPASFKGQQTERDLVDKLARKVLLKQQMKKDIAMSRKIKGKRI
jgi:hypothetical protein